MPNTVEDGSWRRLASGRPPDSGGTGGPRRWTVEAARPVSYETVVVDRLFERGHPLLDPEPCSSGRRFVVIDEQVDRLHGEQIRAYFDRVCTAVRILALPAGEESKSMEQVSVIVDALDRFGIDRRREPIIAIGGGVLLDIVGLAASLYRRGTPYVRIPTTLVGLVDAGVGVKTGVNHGLHKNRLGTYCAPTAVLLDRSFLATLDERQLSNGLAEILKIGLILDRRLFELLEQHGRLLLEGRFQDLSPLADAVAAEVVERAITGMLDELGPNLWEQKLERVVDYGHSVSPLVEMLALPHLLHGEAVAVDMALFTVVAERRGLVSRTDTDRIVRTMSALGLPSRHPLLQPDVLARALEDTVRHRDGLQRLPLPVGIGSARFANDVTVDELVDAAKELEERCGPLRNGVIVADLGDPSVVHGVHGTAGESWWKCLTRGPGLNGVWEAVEWASIPAGGVSGEHLHTRTEEIYLILRGSGEILLNGRAHRVSAGEVILTRVGDRHGLRNVGDGPLDWLVVELTAAHAARNPNETNGVRSG